MTKFSIAVPFRDTKRERIFAAKSLPALAALEPEEILVGVDAPATKDFRKFISEICCHPNVRMIEVPHSNEWNFHLAHVTWDMYCKSHNHIILTTTIDNVLESSVKVGADMAADVGAVTCFCRTFGSGLSGRIRRITARRVRRESARSGIYYMDRRRLDGMPLSKLQSINNGIDVIILDHIEESGHRIMSIPGLVCKALDIENPDYPWRQFGLGVWLFANRQTRPHGHRYLGKLAVAFPILAAFKIAVDHIWPYTISGYVWASKNPGHQAVTVATGASYHGYVYNGAMHIRNIRRWSDTGRTSTGFD